jgi:serine protease Do
MTVLRNGKEQHLKATIAPLENQRQAAASRNGQDRQHATPDRTSALGMQLSPLDEATREQANVPRGVDGVVVLNVSPDSPAVGLIAPGDVIVSVNQQPVTDPTQAGDKLKEAATQRRALLLLNHNGTNHYVGLPLDTGRG